MYMCRKALGTTSNERATKVRRVGPSPLVKSTTTSGSSTGPKKRTMSRLVSQSTLCTHVHVHVYVHQCF